MKKSVQARVAASRRLNGSKGNGSLGLEKQVLKRMEEGCQASLLYVQVKNAGKLLVAMVDSGAEVNVIGRDLVGKIDYESLGDYPLRLSGCGGQSRASKWIRIPLEFVNGQKVEIKAIVGAEFGTGLILGAPFLHSHKVKIDYEGCYLRTEKGIGAVLDRTGACVIECQCESRCRYH